MTRPPKCRAVSSLPGVTYYKPAGIPLRLIEEVVLPVEGLEALRLKDLEGLEQAECAEKMGISRATFQRLLARSRTAVATALINGKALRSKAAPMFCIVAARKTPAQRTAQLNPNENDVFWFYFKK